MKSFTTLAALVAQYHKRARRPQAPDGELLRRFAGQRDAAAFEELVERYASMVWGVCRRMLSSEADCEDAFQATFLVLVRRASSIALGRPLGAWLHTVAVHVSDKTRARALRQPRQTISSEPATGGDIADELGNRELFHVVDEEIARLPALLREPFVLCCLEGRTRDEAAVTLGCSVAAIKSRLERSRNLLRGRLERRGFGLPAAFLVLGLTGGQVQASLRAKTLHCIFSSVPPTVAALVPAIGVSLTRKLALTTMCLAVAGVLSFGAFGVLQTEPPREAPAPAEDIAPQSPSAEKNQQRVDRFGDPLPPGAVRRFGSLRFRRKEIFNVAFSPDGKQLIAGDGCSPLAVFDAVTGRKLREVGKNSLGANALSGFALSPDGKQFACCGSDVYVWSLETGRLIRQLNCGLCREAAFSPDGSILAVALKETTRAAVTGIVIFEAATGKSLTKWTILGPDEIEKFHFGGVTFSPDGKLLAGLISELREERPMFARAISTRVWVFDTSSGARVSTFDLPSVSSAADFQPGTGWLATFGRDGILRFWDARKGKEVQHFPAAKGKEGNDFSSLCFSADGRRCALRTDRAKFVTVLDTNSGRVIRRIEGDEGETWKNIALSRDGRTVASAMGWNAPCVRVWDISSGVERLADAGHRAVPTALSLSPDGLTLISRDEGGQQIQWDVRTGKARTRMAVPRDEGGDLIWSRDFEFSHMTFRGPRWRVVYRHQTPRLMEVWSLDGAKLIRKLTMHGYYVPTVALSPDGSRLAIAESSADGRNYKVMVWDPEREEKPRTLPGAPDHCGTLLFSHDGKRLMTKTGFYPVHSKDAGAVWTWDIAQEQLVRKLVTDGVPGPLLLTSDDRVLLAGIGGGKDATIRAWDMETGKELASLVDPSLKTPAEINYKTMPVISGLDLSADDRFLAVVSSWSDVSAMSIWETGTWKLVRAFPPISPRNNVTSMVFSRDGRSLFVANSDTTILEWDVSGRFGRKTEAPNRDRLNVLWRSLVETPDKVYPAVWEMLDHPTQSLPFLKEKLTPVQPIEEKRVRQLLVQLDSDSFEEREKANRQLLALGEQFLPILRQTLNDRPTPETKRRAEDILELLARGPSAEQMRLLRALAVLEWNNRPDAVEHLRHLASGAPSSSLTRAAKAAVRRLKER
jgi:RNA polymerase sigma factor (sigma-70 family)